MGNRCARTSSPSCPPTGCPARTLVLQRWPAVRDVRGGGPTSSLRCFCWCAGSRHGCHNQIARRRDIKYLYPYQGRQIKPIIKTVWRPAPALLFMKGPFLGGGCGESDWWWQVFARRPCPRVPPARECLPSRTRKPSEPARGRSTPGGAGPPAMAAPAWGSSGGRLQHGWRPGGQTTACAVRTTGVEEWDRLVMGLSLIHI